MRLSIFCLVALACESAPDLPSKDEARAGGGKADDGNDLCEWLGWYDDGVCDDFCPRPDPDCPLAAACDPFGEREEEPTLLVGPDDWSVVLAEIEAAEESIDMLMYQLSRQDFIDALVAAHERGVTVRVVLDRNQDVNQGAREELAAAGVEVRDSPADFRFAHAKLLVIDQAQAIVLSGNLNGFSAVERNHGVVDRDPDDIADAQAIFDADWSADGGAQVPPDLACTRLVVSPINARARLLELIARPVRHLDLALLSLSDAAVLEAIEARAADGALVRVLLMQPGFVSGNAAVAERLAAAGVPVRFLEHLHSKLILSDLVVFVGSENMSTTSLDRNREIGMFVAGDSARAALDQFDLDWAAGTEP